MVCGIVSNIFYIIQMTHVSKLLYLWLAVNGARYLSACLSIAAT